MKRLLLVVGVVLLSQGAFAQSTSSRITSSPTFGPFHSSPFQLRTDVGGRFSGGAGFNSPELALGITPELDLKRFYLRGTSFFRTGNKFDTGDGHSKGAQFEAYLRANRFLLGGGVNYVKLTTSQYEKSAIRPLLGAGVEFKVDQYPSRFFANYYLRGTDNINGVQGLNLRWEVDVKPKVRITPFHFSVFRSFPSNNPQLGTVTSFVATFGVSFVLWSPKPANRN